MSLSKLTNPIAVDVVVVPVENDDIPISPVAFPSCCQSEIPEPGCCSSWKKVELKNRKKIDTRFTHSWRWIMSGRNVDSWMGAGKESLATNNGQPEQQHTSWYENIQFKAQYHHLRTNNYAAIVKSAHSLDKVTTLPTVTVTSPQPPTKAHHNRRDENEPESPPDGGRRSDCWHFPRLTLRHFFSTKSLDDILGRTGHGGTPSTPQKSPSSRRSVPNTSAQFLHPPSTRPRSSSTESSSRIYHPSPRRSTGHVETCQGSPSLLLSHSKSATDIQIEHRAYRYNFPSGPQVVPISTASSDTNCSIPSNKPIPIPRERESGPDTKRLSVHALLSPGRDAERDDNDHEKMKRNNKVEPTTEEGRKLVVTSLSYLQRPSSPNPISPGVSPISTPQGGPPGPVFPSSSQLQLEVPMSRQVKSTRFFTTCCGSGSGKEVVRVAPLNNALNITEGPHETSRGVIPILKNVDPLRQQVSTCSSAEDQKDYRTRNQEQSSDALKGTGSQSKGAEEMADLQSPHYVKRTAHMFQSKFITSPPSHGLSTTSTCSPSYLNVSRSVSGYSCLSYGTPSNGTLSSTTTNNGHGLVTAQNGHASRAPFRTTTRSVLRHHSSSFPSQSPVRGGPSRHHSTDLSPPPLPKSAPPLASPALVGQQRTNGRSMIMDKIERLYGQSEVESSSFLWKRRTPPPEGMSPQERIIPISLDTGTMNGTRTVEVVMVQDQGEDQVDRRYADEGDKIVTTSRSGSAMTKEEIIPGGRLTPETSTRPDLSQVPVLSLPVTVAIPPVHQPITMAPTQLNKENEMSRSTTVTKDGEFFLREVEREKRKIEGLIEAGGTALEACEDPSGEESGKIRAAIGKARLLINKKFKQFEGLCHTNLEQARFGVPPDEPFPTKNEDLEGFWDMVLLQVDHIHVIFDDLDPNKVKETKKMEDSDKKSVLMKSGTANKTTTGRQTTKGKPSQAAIGVTSLRDENRRKMLAEKRKAMKGAVVQEFPGQITKSPDRDGVDDPTESLDEIQIFTPEKK